MLDVALFNSLFMRFVAQGIKADYVTRLTFNSLFMRFRLVARWLEESHEYWDFQFSLHEIPVLFCVAESILTSGFQFSLHEIREALLGAEGLFMELLSILSS
jgi:hypothetical protein